MRVAAERITSCVRASDIRARVGGDEFVVLLDHSTRESAEIVATKLIASLSAGYPDVIPAVTASIGIALWPVAGRSVEELLNSADEAMYIAKRAGKANFVFSEANPATYGAADLKRLGEKPGRNTCDEPSAFSAEHHPSS